MSFERFLLFLLVSLGLMAAVPASAKNVNYPSEWTRYPAAKREPLSLDGYRLAFSEEFDRLDLVRDRQNGRWKAPVHAPLGSGPLAVPPDPKAFSVKDGVLSMRTRRDAKGRWVGVNLQTMDSAGKGFAFRNGYVEARLKLPETRGSHSAFWLLSMHDAERGHAEIDIVESYGEVDRFHHSTVHTWPGKDRKRYPYRMNSNLMEIPNLHGQWRLFGARLTDEHVEIYVDRMRISRIPRLPEQREPLHLLLSVFEHLKDKPDEGATLQVDYVKVWTPEGEDR